MRELYRVQIMSQTASYGELVNIFFADRALQPAQYGVSPLVIVMSGIMTYLSQQGGKHLLERVSK
jgi:hypothetical protein